MSVGKHSYTHVDICFGNWAHVLFYAHNFEQTVCRQPFGLGIRLLKMLFTALAVQGTLMATEQQGLHSILNACSSPAKIVSAALMESTRLRLQISICARWQTSISVITLLICLGISGESSCYAKLVAFLLTSLVTCNTTSGGTCLYPPSFVICIPIHILFNYL